MSVRSVTVKQCTRELQPAPELVKLVGRVSQTTRADADAWWFHLTDGTGSVLLRKVELNFKPIESVEERIAREESEDLEDPPLSSPPWDDGIYMRVLGKLGGEHIDVIQMRPVTNFNEVTTHNLECIYQHCLLTRTQ